MQSERPANSGFTHSPPSSQYAAHIHASVGSVRNTGNAPLELMFHEASHVDAVAGRINRFIEEECRRQKLEVPRELGHFVIMFTSGEVTRRELERTGSRATCRISTATASSLQRCCQRSSGIGFPISTAKRRLNRR